MCPPVCVCPGMRADHPWVGLPREQQEKEALDDLAMELELADEDEPVLCAPSRPILLSPDRRSFHSLMHASRLSTHTATRSVKPSSTCRTHARPNASNTTKHSSTRSSPRSVRGRRRARRR